MNYNIDRFIKPHERYYDIALLEIKEGRKRSHWMWYIFPQLKGLGNSNISEFYGIENLDEAKEYYNNKYLRDHLIEISNALLSLDNNDITSIFNYPDNLKLKSSMTLFMLVDPNELVFSKVLDKYYNGEKDINTINIIDDRR